ncbi:MAG: hypothetical protein NTZ83_02840 [Candidatus Pacearchaeota archaeon]|nr:hypothetical protein [Candidatus Pacearchaeota archaeon]
MINNRDKKGTDKILSIYWFVVLTLIAGGIFAMVYVYYGPPYDVRGIESEIFAERIADCISRGGVMSPDLFAGEGFNAEIGNTFREKCNFNFNVEEGYGDKEEMQYFYKVEFYTLKDLINPAFSFQDGNGNWESECFIKKENNKEYARLAKCTEKRFYALSKGGEQYLIKVLSVIGKSEKNVKQ